MGDFIRYILTAEHDLTLGVLASALKEVDPGFSLNINTAAPNMGDLVADGEVYGEIEFNHPGEQMFREDIEDLREQLEDFDEDDALQQVLDALDHATGMVALQLSEAGHEHYERIDPFWEWLFARFPGLLQIDEEGYYTREELLLPVD